ncbi:MAG: UDP-glucose 4-epimerase GalE [Flavobacteriales bacterium]|nr:UDP-glucose 4-epimerase GalE [Flavobacteriales bacterium]
MEILVTGGAGFIGSHTVVELISAGYQPVIVDDFSNSNPDVIDRIEQIVGQKIKVYNVDCNDEAAINQVFTSHPELVGVIHFAAFKSVGESIKFPQKYYHNNLGSLTTITKMMEKHGVSKLVFSSSCTVYGFPDQVSVDENAPIKEASNPYGHTKQLAEALLYSMCKFSQELDVVLLRYFNPVGAHPSALIGELPKGVPDNLVPYITQTAAGWRGQLTVFGSDYETDDGTCVRDFVHVMDLAEAHVKALQWQNESGNIDVFNIGTGKGTSVKQLIDTFMTVTGVNLPVLKGNRRVGDVPAIFGNTDKANEVLGWSAKRTIDDALLNAWEWQKTLSKPE